jgi:hypothetical protein
MLLCSKAMKPLCRMFSAPMLALLLSAFTTFLPAQEFRATLTGTVTDASGAVVPGAEVQAANTDTGQKYTVKTSGSGGYFIPYMLPGLYSVTAAAPGFQKQMRDNVLLDAAKSLGVNFQLQVGSSTQTVEVTSTVPLLENANGSGGTILTGRQLENLPLNGRQVYTLLGTTPGSQFAQTQFGAAGYSGTRGWDVSNNYTLGGGVQGYQQFTLNGTNITQQTGGGAGTWELAPSLDSLQEVNVQTQTYDARYGRSGGGTVNMVVKSGSNAYHGTAYDYLENGHLNANVFQNNVAGLPKQMIHQNQFGGTFGGPVKKDKIFFFGSYEGYRETIPYSVVASTVPTYLQPSATGVNFNNTAASGITYQVYDPSTTACVAPGSNPYLPVAGTSVGNCPSPNHYGRLPFANNTIPLSRISPAGAAILKLYTAPNTGGASLSNNLVMNAPDVYSYDQPMARVDYDTSDKTRWYSLFAFQHGLENRNTNGLTGVAERGNIDHTRQSLTASQDMTHIFSPTLLADFKLSFARFLDFGNNGNVAAAADASTIGLNMPVIPTRAGPDLPEITLNGFATAVGNTQSNSVYNNLIFDTDFTKTKGSHTIHIGGEIAEFQFANPLSVGNANGAFTFGTAYSQYNPQSANTCPGCSSVIHDNISVADLLLGTPASGSLNYNLTYFDYYPTYAIYVQDDWKISRRLTLNLGLRYDVQTGTKERHNYINRGMCTTCVNPLTNNPTFQAAVNKPSNQAAWTAAGIDPNTLKTVWGGLEFAGANGQPKAGYDTDWTNIQPRFGFAYQANSKTVIRGGYGIMYAVGLEGGTFFGATASTAYIASQNGGLTPTNYFASGNPYPTGVNAPTGNSLGLLTNVGNQMTIDFPQRRIPRSQNFSFGFQRELPWRMVLDASYNGNYTDRLRNGTADSNGGSVWLNGTMPLSQYQIGLANPNYFSRQVPNPYYGSVPAGTTMGTATVPAYYLMTPLYSQFHIVGQANDPLGKERYNALQVKFNKRLYGEGDRGLSFQVAYTWSKTMQANGYINGWPYQDANLLYQLAPTDREHVFTMTGEWAIPVGQGSKFMAHGVLGQIVNGWNVNWITSIQSGFPLSLSSQSYDYQCNHGYAPDGGSTNSNYIYNNYNYTLPNGSKSAGGCWVPSSTISPYFLNYLPKHIGQVRLPSIPNLDLSLSKNFAIWESVRLQFRADALNLTNSPLRQAVDTTPTDGPARYQGGVWSGFGTVNQNQYNFPRIIQLSLKVLF